LEGIPLETTEGGMGACPLGFDAHEMGFGGGAKLRGHIAMKIFYLGAMAFGGLFIILGLFATFYGGWVALKNRDAASWLDVPGVISSSEMRLHDDPDQPGSAYSVLVTYSYSVNGEQLTGNSLNPTEGLTYGTSEAKSLLKQFGKGKKCKVYYDPEQPSRCALIVSYGGAKEILLIGLIAIGGALSWLACLRPTLKMLAYPATD
jgi:hypothetical protein